ncbi:MAG: M48 family metallopeptidase [Microcystis sp. M54BS1]|uniref:M48 family metallopeptidase n=1 Tax=unclassified Microcystis TaxID=2643300 RepID=UPI001D2B6CED|nr:MULTISPECIES: M48 family metallopeptidase [unclassified Microcystis]MBE5227949.1 M48 family metallopeptidase [Microcystis aeruginosa PMC 728.11]MCA2539742.1 M48 family metallopeptidase [Microcystis sp. M54BS1]MCA2594776.1 M48 family metallopeptidase [Microcystis sp. M38BS1]MCA2610702.1 M48 family metallopeptidase [Microcystis sp. M27BS1]MCA2506090.1 M48 family metallopeptidase [Microcystis sp. M62BS1]
MNKNMELSKQLLLGLKANDFRHPIDLEATNSLKQLPGLDIAVRSLLGSVAEEFFYLNNIAASVLVGEKQLPDLHNLLLEACRVLDLEPPQLYIQQNPVPNAYTFAMRGKKPFMVMHTSLIEMLTPAEIQAVIAHELGHLKCEHGVYLTLANIMVLAAGLLPNWGTMLARSLQERMLAWVRCAEFSCDRAALLAVQDPKIVMSVLMKLAGGSPSLAPLLNLEAFIDQAKSYDAVSASEMGEMLKGLQTQQLTHPLPVLRAREIDRWASSPDYQNLLKGPKMGYNNRTNTKGEWRNW